MEKHELLVAKQLLKAGNTGYIKKNVPQTASKYGNIISSNDKSVHCENGTISFADLKLKDIEFITNKYQGRFKVRIKIVDNKI